VAKRTIAFSIGAGVGPPPLPTGGTGVGMMLSFEQADRTKTTKRMMLAGLVNVLIVLFFNDLGFVFSTGS
jgi:hypothetical protein